ncbi:hypothetical protein CLOM_g22818 [Closterium sp. NIES-68]|nr:hypothetical protein CLOM_g22818 [Closterium sp. NIES-68]GJP72805.1 hypothetical protein CLOP_g3562 [Closterium sp. NIES-67]
MRAQGGMTARRRAAVATAHVAGAGTGGGDEGESMGAAGSTAFCVFPLSGVCLPSHSGALNVYDPRMLQLMDVIALVAASPSSPPSAPPRFAMLPSSWTSALTAAAAKQHRGSSGGEGEGGLAGGALTWGDELGGEGEGEGVNVWFKGGGQRSRSGGEEEGMGQGSGEWRSVEDIMRDAPVGCCCVVRASHPESCASRLVSYEATHRVRPHAVRRVHPFLVLLCHTLHDRPPPAVTAAGRAAGAGALQYAAQVDGAEGRVWEQLKEVAWLSAILTPASSPTPCHQHHNALPRERTPPPSAAASLLPSSVLRFGPDAMTGGTRRASSSAQAAISTWRSMKGPLTVERAGGERKQAGGVGSGGGGAAGTEGGWHDPYWMAREALSKARRQEAFSFAAADMVDLEQQHRSLLLGMTCTLERLLWVQSAIEPHLASLRAQMAVRRAMDL